MSKFHNNSGHQGGAVYISLLDNIDFMSSRSCFFQYTDRNTLLNREMNASITFIGNRARGKTAGHSIYTTSIQPCQVVKQVYANGTDYVLVNASNVFDT